MTSQPEPGATATHDRISEALSAQIVNHSLRVRSAETVRAAFYVMERGTRVAFDDVRPGDLIRATREAGGTVHTREHYVHSVSPGVLRGPALPDGSTLTMAQDGWNISLLHRPAPPATPLTGLKPGRVADKVGRVFMYDGSLAYSGGLIIRDGHGHETDGRPWRQLDTLTPVTGEQGPQ